MMYASICHMKRTTIFVPEALERDLQLYAEREGKPVAAVCREAIAEYLVSRRPEKSLPSFTGAFDSGHSDTAARHEEMVFRDLAPHGDPPAAGRRRSGASRRRRSGGPRR